MKYAALPLFALLLAAPTDGTRPIYAGEPPDRYLHPETVGVVLYSNTPEIACGGPIPGGTIYACHIVKGKASITVLPNPCLWAGVEFYATLACHEKAHALLWPSDHPY